MLTIIAGIEGQRKARAYHIPFYYRLIQMRLKEMKSGACAGCINNQTKTQMLNYQSLIDDRRRMLGNAAGAAASRCARGGVSTW